MDGRRLIDYLPPFLQQYKELQAVTSAEEPEIEAVADESERVLDGQFIQTADNSSLSRHERICGITPAASASIDARRAMVLAAYNLDTVYTQRKLREMLASIQGNNDFTVFISSTRIQINMKLTDRGQFEAVKALLYDVIPCNMNIIWHNVGIATGQGPIQIGSAIDSTESTNINEGEEE